MGFEAAERGTTGLPGRGSGLPHALRAAARAHISSSRPTSSRFIVNIHLRRIAAAGPSLRFARPAGIRASTYRAAADTHQY
jgi:hypothetical protein